MAPRRALPSLRSALLAAFLPLVAGGSHDALASDLRSGVGPPFQRLIENVASRYRIDPDLLSALVEVESARNPRAVSRAGAVGLTQLMPATAKRFGVRDRTDPESNLEGGARYLAWLLERYEGNIPLALAAYNAGEGNVDRYSGIPPFPETRGYVKRVMSRAGMSGGAGVASAASSVARKGPPRARLVKSSDGSIELTNFD